MSWWTNTSASGFTARCESREFVNKALARGPGRPPSTPGVCRTCGESIDLSAGIVSANCARCRRKAGDGKSENKNRKGISKPRVEFVPRTHCGRCKVELSAYERAKSYSTCRKCLTAQPSGRKRTAPPKPKIVHVACQTCGKVFTDSQVARGFRACPKDSGCKKRSLVKTQEAA